LVGNFRDHQHGGYDGLAGAIDGFHCLQGHLARPGAGLGSGEGLLGAQAEPGNQPIYFPD